MSTRARFVALAAATSVALSGCTFGAEIANLQPYDPSDGVSLDLEGVALRNVLLITGDGGEANLVVGVENTTGSDIELIIQYGDPEGRVTEVVALPGLPELSQIGSDPATQVIVVDDGIVAGDLFPVYFQYGDEQGGVVEVPVLDGTLPEYELLVP